MAEQDSPQPRGRVWTGPVIDTEQARRITGGAGWTLVVYGGLSVFAMLAGGESSSSSMKVSNLLLAAIFAVPGGFLLSRRSVGAARLAFGISLVLVLMEVAALLLAFTPGGGFMLIAGLIGLLIFGPLCLLSWRSIEAARFLKRKPHLEMFD